MAKNHYECLIPGRIRNISSVSSSSATLLRISLWHFWHRCTSTKSFCASEKTSTTGINPWHSDSLSPGKTASTWQEHKHFRQWFLQVLGAGGFSSPQFMQSKPSLITTKDMEIKKYPSEDGTSRGFWSTKEYFWKKFNCALYWQQ